MWCLIEGEKQSKAIIRSRARVSSSLARDLPVTVAVLVLALFAGRLDLPQLHAVALHVPAPKSTASSRRLHDAIAAAGPKGARHSQALGRDAAGEAGESV